MAGIIDPGGQPAPSRAGKLWLKDYIDGALCAHGIRSTRTARAAARDNKSKKRRTQMSVRLAIGAFEHFDNVIPDAYSIEKALKIECTLLNVGHPKII